jgi:hypothetical protein
MKGSLVWRQDCKRQKDNGVQDMLAKLVGEENSRDYEYVDFYHDMFRMMFQPAPGVAKFVEQKMKQSGLVPGEYVVAHYRAYWGIKKEQSNPQWIKTRAINAVNCASELLPGSQIYFASDSILAIDEAERYAQGKNASVVRNPNQNEPLHLDYASRGNRTYPVADYYDSFVDLWLMGNGRCVTHGVGGFGRFARMLSYDSNCSNEHFHWKTMNKCDWHQL